MSNIIPAKNTVPIQGIKSYTRDQVTRVVNGTFNMLGIYCNLFFSIVFSNFSPLIHAYGEMYSWSNEQDDINFRTDFSEQSWRNDELTNQPGAKNNHNESSSSQFGYRNTEEWGKYYPECRGKRQSPINIDYDSVKRFKLSSPITWTGYETTPRNMTLVNNGHSVQLSASWDNRGPPYISGGVLKSHYVFHQLHYHWGENNCRGSEHTITNYSLPLEMHIVHWKREYGSANEAMKHEDGLAVVGILFRTGKYRNRGLTVLQNFMKNIKNPGSSVVIRPFSLSVFNMDFGNNYFTYMGSLTTPPCSEIVTWILPSTPHILNRRQLNSFRSIQLVGGNTHNFRPTMPLNHRIVYFISH